METKKTPKANLESKRPTWLLVGYVVVLAFMFVAFEWTRDIKIDTSGRIVENVFEQDMEIPLTRQPEVAPPPPPQVTPINDVLTIYTGTFDAQYGGDGLDFISTGIKKKIYCTTSSF